MAETTQYGAVMSWDRYVDRHAREQKTQAALAELVDVDAGTVSRWRSGKQSVDAATAIHFARKVGDDPLVALIAGGHLTPEEAGATPTVAGDYSQLSNCALLELVHSRMREEGEGSGNAAPSNPAGGSPAPGDEGPIVDLERPD